MWEFLQANWTWIFLAGFFVLMLRGGGCGMGHQHSSDQLPDAAPDRRGTTPTTGAQTKHAGGYH